MSASGATDDPALPHAAPGEPLPALESIVVPALSAGVTCPGCGATLHNTLAEPGAKIRCLNCGQRFTPATATAAAVLDTPHEERDSAGPVKLKNREPRAAGYWLLRIPAMIWAGISGFVFLFGMIVWVTSAFFALRYGSGAIWAFLLPPLYLLLLPLSGFYAYVIANSLVKVEAATLKAMWKNGMISNPLPAMIGSSLPYIMPLSAGTASCLAAAMAGASQQTHRGDAYAVAIPFGLLTMAGFLVAFQFEDVRQFFWRQRSMAGVCAGEGEGTFGAPRPGFHPLGILGALAPVLIALGMTVFIVNRLQQIYGGFNYNPPRAPGQPILFGSWNDDFDFRPQVILTIVCFLTVVATAATVYLLASKFAEAVQTWWRAARTQTRRAPLLELNPELIVMDLALLGFACFGTLWTLYMLFFFQDITRRNFELRAEISITFLSIWAGGVCTCAAFSLALRQLRSWRRAQETFWRAKGLAPAPKLSLFYQVVFFGALFLACAEAVAFLGMLIEQVLQNGGMGRSGDFIVMSGTLLFWFALHYPIFWIAFVAREFALAQRLAEGIRFDPAGDPDAK